MDDDETAPFTWSGPKSTWTDKEWANYRTMPWWLRRPVDLFSMIASLVMWMRGRGGAKTRR